VCWDLTLRVPPGFLFAGFRSETYWWEATAYLHKVAVVLIGSLMVDTKATVQTATALAMAALAHAAVLYWRPMRMKRLYRLQAGASGALVGTYLVAIVLTAGGQDSLVTNQSRLVVAWVGVALNVGFACWWLYEVAMRKPVRRLCRRLSARAAAAAKQREEARAQRKEAARRRKKAAAAALPAAFGVAKASNPALELAGMPVVPNPKSRWDQEWETLAKVEEQNKAARAVMGEAKLRLAGSSSRGLRHGTKRSRGAASKAATGTGRRDRVRRASGGRRAHSSSSSSNSPSSSSASPASAVQHRRNPLLV